MSPLPALVSSPPTRAAAPVRQPHRRRFFLRPTRASRPPFALPISSSARYQPPRLAAAQSFPLLAAGAVPRDAAMGLAVLLSVLAAVMTFFLALTILSFSACKVLQKLEMRANKLAKTVAEEVPGTVTSLKLSLMEINDLSSQLLNLRKLLDIGRFGKEARSRTSSRTGQSKQ